LVPWTFQRAGFRRLPPVGWAAAVLVWGAVIWVNAWPGLGAKFGGGLTALVGALATARFCADAGRKSPPASERRGWRIARDLGIGIALLAVFAVGMIWVDSLRPAAEQTHLGDLARALPGDGSALSTIVARKAEMGVRLLTALPFVITLVVVAPVLVVWYYGAGQRSLEALRERPLLQAGIAGTLVGAAAALLLNDSG